MNFDNVDPRLYIIMRSDLSSLNMGKGMAQAAHAANALETSIGRLNPSEEIVDYFNIWKDCTPEGFGTTIVLDAAEYSSKIKAFLNSYDSTHKGPRLYGVVTDPTYPVTDGKVTHLINLDTCGWFFGCSTQTRLNLNLYR